MTTALAKAEPPEVTREEVDLIKKTVAAGATDQELQLYLHDCARHGVHPLDKLLHFTKRGGRYVPITSIDLLRSRAAETGELAGIGDPEYRGEPLKPDFTATVTVWRLVQGQRCPFTATARWAEYKPDQDHMWRRMPHLMLGKCSEALALRKAFPKQLSGLYAREEMDQAEATATEPDKAHVGRVLPPPAKLPDGTLPRAVEEQYDPYEDPDDGAAEPEESPEPDPGPADPGRNPQAASPANGLPADGRELHRRLQDYDAKLAGRKLCVRGALLAHVTRAGVKAGYTANVTDWSGPAIHFAVETVKEFERAVRAGNKPGPDPAADALRAEMDRTGKPWEDCMVRLNFAFPGSAYHRGTKFGELPADHVAALTRWLAEMPALARQKVG